MYKIIEYSIRIKWKWKWLSPVQLFATLWPMEFSRPEYWPTHRLNPGLLHCRQILYQMSHKGSPRILKWVAYPFSRVSSWPRNQTRVSCIAGRFFANWAIREAFALSWYLSKFKTVVLPTVLKPSRTLWSFWAQKVFCAPHISWLLEIGYS